MTKYRDDLVLENVKKELRHPDNHDIYEPMLSPGAPHFGYVPRCMYFYYVRINEDGALAIDHYFFCNGPIEQRDECKPIMPGQVPALVRKLAINGRPRRNKNPPKQGLNFHGLKWDRVSYVAIFFDEANWTFHGKGSGQSAVVFNTSAGKTPNQAFFDAQDVPVRLYNRRKRAFDERSAIVFINHMTKNVNGDFLAVGETQAFKFDMYLSAKFARGSQSAMTVIFDPPTENGGPPLQP